MNYFDCLQRIYVLSINYNDFDGEYLWLNAFSVSLKEDAIVRGKLIDLHFPPAEEFFHLVLGYLGEGEKYPTKIKTFRIDRQNIQEGDKLTTRVIYDCTKNDFRVMVDETLEIDSAYHGDDNYFPGKDLPKASYSIDYLDILWILDGTLPKDIFTKVKNTALLLSRKMKNFTDPRVGFIVFGEYEKLWKMKINQTSSLGAFEARPNTPVFMPLDEFRRQLQKMEPMPPLKWDDPASAIELVLKKVTESITFSINRFSWVIIVGDSLPHFSISQLMDRDVEIIPTEEFLNIAWKDEVEKVLAAPNLRLISCWVEDSLSPKWLASDNDGVSHEYNNAKHWWTSELPSHFSSIVIEPGHEAKAIMQDIYEILFHESKPRFYLTEKLRLPLKKKLYVEYPQY